MTSKLLEEEAIKFSDEVSDYGACSGFIAGAKWLLEEAKTLAFPEGTEDQVVRLSDLKKLVE